MFLQVIQGKVVDPERFSASLDRWVDELGPSADGWLGTTSGTYGDNSFIALVRFESAEAAKRNSDRPEQGQWWADFASSLDGEASFDDFDDVVLMGPGGSDEAGFVQVMRGRVADVERERADAWLAVSALHQVLSTSSRNQGLDTHWEKAIDKTLAWLAKLA